MSTSSVTKGGKIYLRTDQSIETKALDNKIKVYAPSWVKKALQKLSKELKGAKFEIAPPSGQFLTIEEEISLTYLITITRNEDHNVDGVINFNLYNGIKNEAIIALRDLVKHCVIIGSDTAIGYGGFKTQVTPQRNKVYICDLPGLQFQENNNTGRHVLIPLKGKLPKGALDGEIFENTVGEKKATVEVALRNKLRYLPGSFNKTAVLFDTKAFQAFIAQDFLLAGTMLNAQAKKNHDEISFKFLKYGAGFFAENLEGEAKSQLVSHLTIGVEQGLRKLLALPKSARSQIKRIELPFYEKEYGNNVVQPETKAAITRIRNLCVSANIVFSTDAEDALKPTSKYITATTNCSDPHAPTGNEMGHNNSVDATIAENLQHKGNNFNPCLNTAMKQSYVTINHLPLEKIKRLPSAPKLPILQAASVGTFAFICLILNFTWPIALSAAAVTSFISFFGFKHRNEAGYQTLLALPANKSKLPPAQQDVFNDGIMGAQSFLSHFSSFFSKRNWKEYNLYNAGVQFEQDRKNKLKS